MRSPPSLLEVNVQRGGHKLKNSVIKIADFHNMK